MQYTLTELQQWNEVIETLVAKEGLNVYEQMFEIIDYKDMLDYEAYTGMPSRYPHWSYGKAYEKNRTLYQYNLTGLPYEMVINSDPCLAYLMKENSLLLQILTIAHVYGHNDFFKNNRLFKQGTDAKATIEVFKRNADMVRSYVNDPSIGYKNIETLLDAVHSVRFQVARVIGDKRISDEELKQQLMSEYKDSFVHNNPLKPYIKQEPPDLSRIPLNHEDDLLYFITKHGDMEDWERNIVDIVRREALYFIPQIETKIMNEGWASYWHYNILKELELSQELYLEFIKRHNDVIAPIPMIINPYYLGFKIFQDIEARYGRKVLFEVRALERDESFIRRYLTQELCEEMHLYDFINKGDDYIVEDVADEKGWANIRNVLCNTCGMNNIPNIRVVEMQRQDKTLILEHIFDGRELQSAYTEATLKYIYDMWKHPIKLLTIVNGKSTQIICDNDKNIRIS
ncbi:MAG: SpoVR family protein [Lutisporaceae bacterium]